MGADFRAKLVKTNGFRTNGLIRPGNVSVNRVGNTGVTGNCYLKMAAMTVQKRLTALFLGENRGIGYSISSL